MINAWPEELYVATLEAGVYYTADFSGPGGGDPTWTAVNGYDGGDLSDDWDCVSIQGDKDYPGSHQYLLIQPHAVVVGAENEYRRLLYRGGSGDWVDWLNNTQAASILGVADTRIQLFYADRATGYVNVILKDGAVDSGAGTIRLLQATTPLGDFTEVSTTGIGSLAFLFDSFITYGSRWMFSSSTSVVSRSRMYYSIDGGAGWNYVSNAGGAGAPRASFKYDINTPDIAYFDKGTLNEISQLDLTTGEITELEGDELGSLAVDSMWFSPDDSNKQRATAGDEYDMYTTLNRWAAYDVQNWGGSIEIGGIYWGPSGYTDNLLLLARDDVIEAQPDTIYVWDGVTLEGKSGVDPVLGTDSIPISGSGGVDFYSVLMVSGFPACIPLTGVAIVPPDEENVCTDLTFTATVTPDNATTPITYTWTAADLQSGQGTSAAVYNYTGTCDKSITVSATNPCTLVAVMSSTLSVELTLHLSQIAEAIQDTLEDNMTASLLSRVYGWDELPEGINDSPSLLVYWQSAMADAITGTDRYTFSGVRNKELLYHVDYFASVRNNLAENNARITNALTEIIDILETESAAACTGDAQCPPFGLCALKTFNWNCERVIFEYGNMLYYGARCEIRLRVF